ncbi:hypothetical protein BDV24DRAFT_143248 [Aspergillus arachidicola]|uniref:Uncharacterized protein n=1 Tax=Aspergillus arachidicola TaxID=656916 RepID=A0A5N6XRB2_9EURO|nr:hypothetical protein BDV24DRAFT_143248 [Aspergillus arachidicola]
MIWIKQSMRRCNTAVFVWPVVSGVVDKHRLGILRLSVVHLTIVSVNNLFNSVVVEERAISLFGWFVRVYH